MKLLTVGSVAFDAIETPFGKSDRIVGGAGTYISLAASFFTREVGLVSVVGDDFPNEVLEDLNRRGINTQGVEIRKGEKSFFWSGKYHIDMNTRDTLATELNVLAGFQPKVPQAFKDADFLMLGNLTPAVQADVISQMQPRPRLVVMDTMNFWMTSALEDLKNTLKLVDVLAINDEEARLLSGEYSLVKAAQKITAMGPHYLIIKKGEHGALLFRGAEEVFFAPALPLEDVFDPTGAGDTFAGGFVGYLASTGDISFDNMKRAVIYGSAMASFCVEKFGIQKLTELQAEELQERVHQFIELVQFDISLV
jgi:sugar/nucleoside kinase (ribokinase family)